MNISIQRFIRSISSATVVSLVWTSSALAAGGIGDLPDIPGGTTTDLRSAVVSVLNSVINFLGLLMVIAIVVAGFRLVLSQGEEDAKEKAKKGIFYAIIGLVLVLLAKAIVMFVTTALGAS